MDTEKPYIPPSGMAEMFAWVTVTHLALIALLAAGAIAILWWGRKLQLRRKAAREEAERIATEREEQT